jgi:hypothetical protein
MSRLLLASSIALSLGLGGCFISRSHEVDRTHPVPTARSDRACGTHVCDADETCVNYRCVESSASATHRQCGVEVCARDQACVESDGVFRCR